MRLDISFPGLSWFELIERVAEGRSETRPYGCTGSGATRWMQTRFVPKGAERSGRDRSIPHSRISG
jgi:hypothetical protein